MNYDHHLIEARERIEHAIEFNAEKAHYWLRRETISAIECINAEVSYAKRSITQSLRWYNFRKIGCRKT